MEGYIRFFTATILNWQSLLKPDKYKDIMIASLKFLHSDNRAWIYGFVIMPNHVHIIWRMKGNHQPENVQRDFLKFTAQKIKDDLQLNHKQVLPFFYVNAKDRKYQFWQRKPYTSEMYNRKVVEQKLEYMHNNPLQVKWKLANLPEECYYSSARFYLLNDEGWDFITHYAEHI